MSKPLLRRIIEGDIDISTLDVPMKPGFSLRDYQKVAVAAFLSHRNLLLYDQTGFGKTIQSYSPYVLKKERIPNLKFIYVTVKSALFQAEEEFNRFFDGFNTVAVRSEGWSKEKRLKHYKSHDIDCYFMTHRLFVLDAEHIARHLTPFVLVLDEANYFKGLKSQAHKVALIMRDLAVHTWLLTADPIENSIKDAYGLIDIVDPSIFGDYKQFEREFCITKEISIPRPAKWKGKGPARVKVNSVVDYTNKDEFKRRFNLVAFGRSRADVENELPDLTVRNILLQLSRKDRKLYEEIEEGLLDNLTGYDRLKDHVDEEKAALENMIRCQQILGCPQKVYDTLLENQDDLKDRSKILTAKRIRKLEEEKLLEDGEDYIPSEYDFNFSNNWDARFKSILSLLKDYTLDKTVKSEELLRLLRDELKGEKVIVFSSYLSVINFLEPILAEFNPLRITGAEDAKTRNINKNKFTDAEGSSLLLVTTAAVKALNLQAASTIICHDPPNTWGKLRQLVGRMIRIGSKHKMVNLINLIVEKTVDHKVQKKLFNTQEDVEMILGSLGKDKVVSADMFRKS